MLEYLDSPADVLAVKVTGTLTGEELDSVMDRVDAMMAEHETFHVYVESHGFDGLQLSALPHYLGRALPMLGKLKRFGRVAVVADQTWLRALTKVESAILPFISYRVFEPSERQAAIDFAFGR